MPPARTGQGTCFRVFARRGSASWGAASESGSFDSEEPRLKRKAVSSTYAPICRNSLSQFSKTASPKLGVVRYCARVIVGIECSICSPLWLFQPVRTSPTIVTAKMPNIVIASPWSRRNRIASPSHSRMSCRECTPDARARPAWGLRSASAWIGSSSSALENGWFVHALASGEGHIRAGGVERDVAFERPDSTVDAGVEEAYHAKYDRHGPRIVGTVVGPEAARTTLRLAPR